MLFPAIDLDDMNGAFQRGLQLIDAALCEMRAGDVEERVLDDVKEWSPPPSTFKCGAAWPGAGDILIGTRS